jgi:hypothetical protein
MKVRAPWLGLILIVIELEVMLACEIVAACGAVATDKFADGPIKIPLDGVRVKVYVMPPDSPVTFRGLPVVVPVRPPGLNMYVYKFGTSS